MTTLPNLIKDRLNELGLSYRAAADRSGGLISHATLNNVVTGRYANISDDTLHGIALGLDLPLSKVREAAGASKEVPTEFRLPKKAAKLTVPERQAVLKMVEVLLAAHGEEPEK